MYVVSLMVSEEPPILIIGSHVMVNEERGRARNRGDVVSTFPCVRVCVWGVCMPVDAARACRENQSDGWKTKVKVEKNDKFARRRLRA